MGHRDGATKHLHQQKWLSVPGSLSWPHAVGRLDEWTKLQAAGCRVSDLRAGTWNNRLHRLRASTSNCRGRAAAQKMRVTSAGSTPALESRPGFGGLLQLAAKDDGSTQAGLGKAAFCWRVVSRT